MNDLHAHHTAEKWWSWAGIQGVRALCIAQFSPCLAHSKRSLNSGSFPSLQEPMSVPLELQNFRARRHLALPFPLEVALVTRQIPAFSGG